MTVRVPAPKVTVADLMRAKEREERNLDARQRELRDARLLVTSLERQVSNVELSIDELDERINGATAAERVAALEEENQRLRRDLAMARDTRDGREFG
jgi:hypothetical protein